MSRESFFPNPGNKPQGYSPATRVGKLVFVSGQVSVSGDGKLVGRGDCRAQSEQCFRNIDATLRSAGAAMDEVTKITAFLVNPEDYPAYASVRHQLFPENGPASSTVFIKGLVNPEFLVEIEAVAVVG